MKKLKLCLSKHLLWATKLTRFVIKDDVKVLTQRSFKNVYSDTKFKLSSTRILKSTSSVYQIINKGKYISTGKL